jgi:hypothetical protein
MSINLPADVRAALAESVAKKAVEYGFSVTEDQVIEAALRQYLSDTFEFTAHRKELDRIALMNSRVTDVLDMSVVR